MKHDSTHKGRVRAVNFDLPPSFSASIVRDLRSTLDALCTNDEVEQYRMDYLRKEVFSKYCETDSSSAQKRERAAIDKWLKTEVRNQKTNIRLYGTSTVFKHGDNWFSSDDVIRLVRKYVEEVLGSTVPPELVGSFSGGASTSVKRSVSAIAEKYVGSKDVTPDALAYFNKYCKSPCWDQYNADDPREVLGNVLFTVPKNSDIDRVACKEPELNMYLQKGCGDFIRHRLRLFGQNLNDQTRNAGLSRQGSIDGLSATIDLSSASDSVTRACVAIFLPVDWFVLLDSIRSAYTLIGDVWHENQMFSSMGNGFTFELETLIFWALTRAVCRLTSIRGRISVYGDDIIAPSTVCKTLKAVFGYFGFLINEKKSAWTGHFRESCGAHWYNGTDIKPFYVRGPISDLPKLITLLNQVRGWTCNMDANPANMAGLYSFWYRYAQRVPVEVWGGYDVGDSTRLVSLPRVPQLKLKRLTNRTSRCHRRETELSVGRYLQSLDYAGESPREPVRYSQVHRELRLARVHNSYTHDSDTRRVRPLFELGWYGGEGYA